MAGIIPEDEEHMLCLTQCLPLWGKKMIQVSVIDQPCLYYVYTAIYILSTYNIPCIYCTHPSLYHVYTANIHDHTINIELTVIRLTGVPYLMKHQVSVGHHAISYTIYISKIGFHIINKDCRKPFSCADNSSCTRDKMQQIDKMPRMEAAPPTTLKGLPECSPPAKCTRRQHLKGS
jgi:hypothetical protein